MAPADPSLIAAPAAAAPVANPGGVKVPLWLFGLELGYLLALFAGATLFAQWGAYPRELPDPLGPLPLAVVWFGALGAVVIGLTGVFTYQNNWNHAYDYWHVARPFTGASYAVVGVLIFMTVVSVASTGSPAPSAPGKLIYNVVAFLIGYREETFRELVKRVTDLLFSPILPDNAPAAAAPATPEPAPPPPAA